MSTVSTEAPLSDGTLAPAVPTLTMSEVALNDPSNFSGRASPRPATMVQQRAARYEANNRPGSAPGTSRTGVLAVPRSQHENAMLTSIRRHMEALEEKLGGQISRVQLQSDRLRDAAFARVDQKMGSMEALQPKFDRRLAELSGNYKGLSDEMQAQIKRVDQLDSKIWDFRHQLEEELRTKMSELEAGQQKASSELRVANATSEDQQKRQNQRILRLERLLEERLPAAEDTALALNDLCARVAEVETGRHDLQLAVLGVSQEHAAVSHNHRSEPVESAVDSAALAHLEKRLADACQKLEAFHHESHELHIKVEAQEERLKSLRTRIETEEEKHRTLGDRVERMDAQREIKEVKDQIAEMNKERTDHSESLQLLQKSHEAVAQDSSDMRELLRKLQLPQHSEASEVREAGVGGEAGPASEALAEEVQDCLRQLGEAKGRIDELTHEVNTVKADMDLGPRVGALVDQLKQVAPKVMDQELSVRELHERMGRIEVQSRLGEERTASEGTLGRIGKLESEVDRIKERVRIEALGAAAQGEVSAAGVSG